MPLRVTLECPIDGSALTTNAVLTIKGQPTDSHVHIDFPRAPMTCSQGHRWRIVGDLKLTREA
jgi:hypothetical protein